LNKPAFAAERRPCCVRACREKARNDEGQDRIEWLSNDENGEVAQTAEPDHSPLTALKLSLLSQLIAEDLL